MKIILNLIILSSLSISSIALARSTSFECHSTTTDNVVTLKLQYESLISGQYIDFAGMKYDMGGSDINVYNELPAGSYISTVAVGSGVGSVFFGSQQGLILEKSLLSGATDGIVAIAQFKNSGYWSLSKDDVYKCRQ